MKTKTIYIVAARVNKKIKIFAFLDENKRWDVIKGISDKEGSVEYTLADIKVK